MQSILDFIGKKNCVGCSACVNICPKHCLKMGPDEEGFLYPILDAERCVNCQKCYHVCPENKYEVYEGVHEPSVYAAKAKGKVREESSSGGIFSLLAETVLADGGVVFGAAFDTNCTVIHRMVKRKEDLSQLRGAKYVQSQLGDTYSEVKLQLEHGKKVLFSGTPCQVYGLQCFLQTEYENLFLVDIVCHGVPSPLVWQKYLEGRGKGQNGMPQKVNFRDKVSGWSRYGYSVTYESVNGKREIIPNKQDLFMQGFVKNVYLRSCCGQCEYKFLSRKCDITLGDYWGIWNQAPEMDDNKGTSLVLVHSEKGKGLWNQIGSLMEFKEMDAALAIEENPSVFMASREFEKRAEFFRYLKEGRTFQEAERKVFEISIIKRVWHRLFP